jgi:hypothetical protein
MNNILVVGRESRNTSRLIQALLKAGFVVCFLEERRNDKVRLLWRRFRRFGVVKFIDQFLFLLFVKLKTLLSRKPRYIRYDYSVNNVLKYVTGNINSYDIGKLRSDFTFELVVLSGSRILTSESIKAMQVPVVNIHAGITPNYRGVHGGYWSLRQGDKSSFGSTIHLVDQGIDTGRIIERVYCEPRVDDDFTTYQLTQFDAALPVFISQVQCYRDYGVFDFKSYDVGAYSGRAFSHPGLTDYIRGGVK